MRVNAITMRDHFGGGVSFGGGTRGGVGFLCKRLPELFTHTIVWVYWKPRLFLRSSHGWPDRLGKAFACNASFSGIQ